MAIVQQTKKRDRVFVTASDQEDEYELALAFLREFHSRRVAAFATHSSSSSPSSSSSSAVDRIPTTSKSTPLDAIVEEGDAEEERSCCRLVVDVDELLSSDFALALDIGEYGADNDYGVLKATSISSLSPSRMKKATTTECLLDLGGESPSSIGVGRREDRPPTISLSRESDDYFCHDLPPSTKRSRGRYLPLDLPRSF
ncbi:hypothetical protein ACHAW5_007101 [Stephanodiscus triporus]|uniref:Uncharacterized protein n=1 Tax=Stephanodiscus triporus TaxID=2934178 RepID=A0ABD3NJ35_9STRA